MPNLPVRRIVTAATLAFAAGALVGYLIRVIPLPPRGSTTPVAFKVTRNGEVTAFKCSCITGDPQGVKWYGNGGTDNVAPMKWKTYLITPRSKCSIPQRNHFPPPHIAGSPAYSGVNCPR